MNWLDAVIAYIVLFVFFMIARFLIFPHLRVGVYALKPTGLWVGAWRVLMTIMFKIFIIVVLVLHVFWLLWLFIKMFIPNFPIPLKFILLRLPPFPQLERAGIFSLLSSIWGIIFSTKSGGQRFKDLGVALGDFFTRNIDLAFSTVGLGDTVEKIQYATRDKSTSPEPPPTRSGVPPPPTNFEASENRQIDELYQQCLEENLADIDGTEMSEAQQKTINAQNQATKTMCGAKRVQAHMNLYAFGR